MELAFLTGEVESLLRDATMQQLSQPRATAANASAEAAAPPVLRPERPRPELPAASPPGRRQHLRHLQACRGLSRRHLPRRVVSRTGPSRRRISIFMTKRIICAARSATGTTPPAMRPMSTSPLGNISRGPRLRGSTITANSDEEVSGVAFEKPAVVGA